MVVKEKLNRVNRVRSILTGLSTETVESSQLVCCGFSQLYMMLRSVLVGSSR